MRFQVSTIVWGPRHTEMFLGMTLPNLLSAGNLPALAAAHEVTYRIYTGAADRARIEADPHARRLAGLARLELSVPLGERAPEVAHHVHWFHRAAAEAKRDGTIAVFVPPDTLWPDGALARCGAIMAAGKKAIAVPFLQVVAETCMPEALRRFGGPPERGLAIPAPALVDLARRHLHPLTALSSPGSPHGRPALEMHWPMPGAGFVSRFAVRELFALDPRRCPMTYLWYAGGPEDREGIHFAGDSDEMVMLSVDPLDKYLPIYILDHRVVPADVARSTLHPLNDTEQTRGFAGRAVRWHQGPIDRQRWRRRERAAEAAFSQVVVQRVAMRLWALLRRLGCTRAAGILAVALNATALARRWREAGPLTVFAPSDQAFAAVPPAAIDALLGPGHEAQLLGFVRAHVMPGAADPPPGIAIQGKRHQLDWLSVAVVDRLLADPAGSR